MVLSAPVCQSSRTSRLWFCLEGSRSGTVQPFSACVSYWQMSLGIRSLKTEKATEQNEKPARRVCYTQARWRFDRQSLGFILQYLVCKRKLESKKEALLILSKELDTCQQERDQYKLMANQLRERHQSLKKKYRELIVRITSQWRSWSLVKIERRRFNMLFLQKRIEFKQFQSGKIKKWKSSSLFPPQPSSMG